MAMFCLCLSCVAVKVDPSHHYFAVFARSPSRTFFFSKKRRTPKKDPRTSSIFLRTFGSNADTEVREGLQKMPEGVAISTMQCMAGKIRWRASGFQVGPPLRRSEGLAAPPVMESTARPFQFHQASRKPQSTKGQQNVRVILFVSKGAQIYICAGVKVAIRACKHLNYALLQCNAPIPIENQRSTVRQPHTHIAQFYKQVRI